MLNLYNSKKVIKVFLVICLLTYSCTFSTGTKVESYLGIPRLHIPDNWMVSKQDCSDSTFAIKSNSLDTENKKFTESIVLYKERLKGLFGTLLNEYTDEVKHKYDDSKFETVDDYETAKFSGVLIDYTYRVNQYHLFTAVYICKIVASKNPFIITYTCYNEPNDNHIDKRKIFLQFLSKSF